MNTEIEPGATIELDETHDSSLAVQVAAAEMSSEIITAKKFPRKIKAVMQSVFDLATLDDVTAQECVYAIPRAGKVIRGPSVRLAEIIVNKYGNCHVGSRIVDVNKFDKYVTAEGVFLDLETGFKSTAQIRRKIAGKDGRLYSDDMIVVTGNAAASIAKREAILKGVPKAIWRKAYEACEKVAGGSQKTLAERRQDMLTEFGKVGVIPDQIFASLEIEGEDDITTDHIVTLGAIYRQCKEGEQDWETFFPSKRKSEDAVAAAKGTAAQMQAIAEGADPDTGEVKDEPPAPDPADLGKAYNEGVDAGVKGMSRRAMPSAYGEVRELEESWATGFDHGKAKAKTDQVEDGMPA